MEPVPIATLNSRSQATIPRAVRDALGLSAGDRIEFRIGRHGVRMHKASDLELAGREADDVAFGPEWLSAADEEAWRDL